MTDARTAPKPPFRMMRRATKQDAGKDFVSFDAHGHPCIGGRLTVAHLWLNGYTNTCRPAVIAEPDYGYFAERIALDLRAFGLPIGPDNGPDVEDVIRAALEEVL